ncbi:MAG: carboxypeptidase [Anaerolineae bacterium SM23_ 63]|nr:MAG: carboxypeptidase [Anaerolineae bacterium SM23_ 63]HEY47114.1 carboxypeptidase M32 [Anaerolineae bacterium]
MTEKFQQFRKLVGEIFDLDAVVSVLEWDQQTYMPSGGAQVRAMQIATVYRLWHENLTGDEFSATLEAAKEETANLDPDSDEVRIIRHMKREVDQWRKVPSEWVGEFKRTTTLAHQAWEEARANDDFAHFQTHLEEIVKLRQQYSEFFAPFDHPYDPLLDYFEPGMKTSDVKAVFNELRPRQVELVREIAERGSPVDDSVLRQDYDVSKQWDFGVEVIKALGYDFNRGRQDRAAHPFTTSFGIGDVRITTRFDPKYLGTALFGTIHEAGHAMYDQGVSPSLDRTDLITGASYGVHESQSRMMENLVGRSRPFWVAFFPRLQKYFPSQLGEVDMESFYRAINKVEPSLIRVEADEATYNLHIMLRFEIEIALAENKLSVADLPEVWNSKMEEYLDLTPPNDAKGVLQDVHWSSGYIGYFATYSLGNLMASQFWAKMEEDIPDLTNQIERAQFTEMLNWLRENIHQHGAKFEPLELLQRVTGNTLSVEPYLHYLSGKYEDIYKLS